MDQNEKFDNFMRSFCAAAELGVRAAEHGCFVEFVVLTAAVIDGTLRMGLILKHQLETTSDVLLPELLHQGESDPMISEREVYRRCLAQSVIKQDVFDELNRLYDERNRVVHRYVISAITTKDVLDIGLAYDALKQRVSDAVALIEEEQIRLGVGMTVRGDKADVQDVLDLAAGKHGDQGLTDALRGSL